jgi:hypothetical protein
MDSVSWRRLFMAAILPNNAYRVVIFGIPEVHDKCKQPWDRVGRVGTVNPRVNGHDSPFGQLKLFQCGEKLLVLKQDPA